MKILLNGEALPTGVVGPEFMIFIILKQRVIKSCHVLNLRVLTVSNHNSIETGIWRNTL